MINKLWIYTWSDVQYLAHTDTEQIQCFSAVGIVRNNFKEAWADGGTFKQIYEDERGQNNLVLGSTTYICLQLMLNNKIKDVQS